MDKQSKEPASQQAAAKHPQTAHSQNNPEERLKDGTNDFQNGDQEPTSEGRKDPEEEKK